MWLHGSRASWIAALLVGALVASCGSSSSTPMRASDARDHAERLARWRTNDGHPVLSPSAAMRIDVEGTWLVPVHEGAKASDARAFVKLPRMASQHFELREANAQMTIRVGLQRAREVAGVAAGGYVVYPGGSEGGGDIVHRPLTYGTEDFVVFESRPLATQLTYTLSLEEGVAGLRLVAGTLELLDARGAPRLRMNEPYLVDATGARHAVRVDVRGCAFDHDPRVPWERPVLAPGARQCEVAVAWANEGVTYPAVVDPAWVSGGTLARPRSFCDRWLGNRASQTILLPLQDGGALVVGGEHYPAGADLSFPFDSIAERFDATSKTWTRTAGGGTIGPPGSRLRDVAKNPDFDGDIDWISGAVLTDGSVLVVGQDAAYRYTPATNAWTVTGTMAAGTACPDPPTPTCTPVGRVAFAIAPLPGARAIVVGGHRWKNHDDPFATAVIYDAATNAWSAAPSLPKGRHTVAAAALADGRVVVAGGFSRTDPFVELDRATFLFDPRTSTWAAGPPLGQGREGEYAFPLPSGGVYFHGRGMKFDGTPGPEDGEAFDPATSTFRGVLLPTFSMAAVATASSGHLFAIGGTAELSQFDMPKTTVEVRADGDSAWSVGPSLATARVFARATRLASGAVLVVGGLAGSGMGDPADDIPVLSAEVLTLNSNGQACAKTFDCASGFCVDGVCCASACTETCKACTAAKKHAGTDGVCDFVQVGESSNGACAKDPGVCGRTGMCDGKGACEFAKAEVSCGIGCDGATVAAFQCNGQGACASTGRVSVNCRPYACRSTGADAGATAQCATQCATNADCDSNATCRDRVCVPNLTNCESAADCKPGERCNVLRQCVPDTMPIVELAGCNLAAPRAPSVLPAMFVLFGLAGMRRRSTRAALVASLVVGTLGCRRRANTPMGVLVEQPTRALGFNGDLGADPDSWGEPDCRFFPPLPSSWGDLYRPDVLRATYQIMASVRYPFARIAIDRSSDEELARWTDTILEGKRTPARVAWAFSTAAHEGFHGADSAYSRPNEAAFIVRPDRILRSTYWWTFSPRELIRVHPRPTPEDNFARNYLYNAHPNNSLMTLLDEVNAYTHSLAVDFCLRDVNDNVGGSIVADARHGLYASLLFVELYLAVARTAYPRDYASMKADPGLKIALSALWKRAALWLERTNGLSSYQNFLMRKNGPADYHVWASDPVRVREVWDFLRAP